MNISSTYRKRKRAEEVYPEMAEVDWSSPARDLINRTVLTESEFLYCAHCAATIRFESLQQGRRNAYGMQSEYGWMAHINGSLGEHVVAKFLGVPAGIGNSGRGPDIGHFQVRYTPYSAGCLTIREHDNDDDVFVLVCGDGLPDPEGVVYEIPGGIVAREARAHPEWYHNHFDPSRPPAFFVPRTQLHPRFWEIAP